MKNTIKKVISNSRGYTSGGVISVLLFFMAGYLIVILPFKGLENKIETREESLESYAKEIIVEVENDGYISDGLLFDIEKTANDEGYDNVDVDGSLSKVESGERVFLKIEAYKEKSNGKRYQNVKILEEGIAK